MEDERKLNGSTSLNKEYYYYYYYCNSSTILNQVKILISHIPLEKQFILTYYSPYRERITHCQDNIIKIINILI